MPSYHQAVVAHICCQIGCDELPLPLYLVALVFVQLVFLAEKFRYVVMA
jgi:hypothetical protein